MKQNQKMITNAISVRAFCLFTVLPPVLEVKTMSGQRPVVREVVPTERLAFSSNQRALKRKSVSVPFWELALRRWEKAICQGRKNGGGSPDLQGLPENRGHRFYACPNLDKSRQTAPVGRSGHKPAVSLKSKRTSFFFKTKKRKTKNANFRCRVTSATVRSLEKRIKTRWWFFIKIFITHVKRETKILLTFCFELLHF